MESRTRIGRNLDTCKRGPTLIKLMGYKHRDDAVGGGGASNGNHTVSLVIHTVDVASARIGRNLYTCKHDPTLIKLMGYEHRDDTVGGVGEGNIKHTHTHTHTHTNSVPRDRQGGWSLKQ